MRGLRSTCTRNKQFFGEKILRMYNFSSSVLVGQCRSTSNKAWLRISKQKTLFTRLVWTFGIRVKYLCACKCNHWAWLSARYLTHLCFFCLLCLNRGRQRADDSQPWDLPSYGQHPEWHGGLGEDDPQGHLGSFWWRWVRTQHIGWF